MRFMSVHVMHPYNSIDTTIAWEKFHFIFSDKLDFHVIDNFSIAVRTFANIMYHF